MGKRKREQFVVDRLLPDGGLMVQVTLERPLGIVFEPDTAGKSVGPPRGGVPG